MATPRGAKHRDLEQRLRDLEADVRAAISAALRRPKFEVSAGDLTINGGDLVVDGGDFLLLDTDGSTVFRLGPQTHGDRGVAIVREDGQTALAVRKRFSNSTDQSVGIYSRDAVALLEEEELGDGFASPWFPLHVQPYHPTGLATAKVGPQGLETDVDSASWTTTHFVEYPRQNQYLRAEIAVRAHGLGAGGEVRVIDAATGNALGAFLQPAWTGTRATGTFDYVRAVSPALFAPGAHGEVVRIEVQCRRTVGTALLTVAVPYMHGSSGA